MKDDNDLNSNYVDPFGETKEQKDDKKADEAMKSDKAIKANAEVDQKLKVIKIMLRARKFGEAERLLDEAEDKEKEEFGYCGNSEIYWCRVLLKYQARDEQDLVSKYPDLENDDNYSAAVEFGNDEEKQKYQAVLNKINQSQVRQPIEQSAQSAAKAQSVDNEQIKKRLRRISHMIDAGDFDEAKERIEKIEQEEEDRTGDCEIPQIYHYKMLLDYKACTDEELIACLIERREDITKNKNYKYAKGYAEDADDDDEFDALLKIKKQAAEGIAKAKAEEERKLAGIIKQADDAFNNKEYKNAIDFYNQAIQLGASDLQTKVEQAQNKIKEEEARKAEEARKEKERKEREAKINALLNIGDYKDLGNGYITFGAYPQSKKASSVKIGEVFDKERGYYLGSDNCLYDVYNGDYYKVEPIKWKVLSRGSECFVVSDLIIDQHRFDGDSNNYANSEIRSWLNGEFYNKAFRDGQKSKIVTTNVDNSLSSTGDSENEYVCGNTSDKVFLLSRKEAGQYLNSNEARKRVPTEYAVKRGAYQYSGSDSDYKRDGKGCGWWWLRSPFYYDSNFAQYVSSDGYFIWSFVNYISFGALPALKIKP